MGNFRLTISVRHDDEAHIAAEGRIDADEAAQLIVIVRALLDAGAQHIVVDLAHVDTCHPSLRDYLRQQKNHLKVRGGWMIVDGSPATTQGIDHDLVETFTIYQQARHRSGSSKRAVDPGWRGAAPSGAGRSLADPAIAVELQRLLIGAERIEAFLTEVAVLAAGAVERAQSVGITVGATRWSPTFGATSDDLAEAMDAIQYEVDDGPCLTCLRTGESVVVGDIGADQRWPAFGRRGQEAGAAASLSVPLQIDGGTVGALNLYSRHALGLHADDHVRARQFADHAAGAVALARMLMDREELAGHLETALASRSVIDQALGVLMARTGADPARAFTLLREQSQHTNDKLRDVAADIVAWTVRTSRRP